MSEAVLERTRWTRADLDLLPDDDGTRYEIIDGKLWMARQPHWHHQETCGNVYGELQSWSRATGLGRATINPGVLFSEADDVVPDVAWASHERLAQLMDAVGHLTGAPELVVEVLSPGSHNERRDREAKLRLYEAQGVSEYWILDWHLQRGEVYRRTGDQLQLNATLGAADKLSSPLLPDFACVVTRFFV